jgi:hypothetical protein
MPVRVPRLRLPVPHRSRKQRPADGAMPLLEHLLEFRRRLFFAVLGIFPGHPW